MPTTDMLSTQPIFLAYTHSGPGHYDCAVSIPIERTSIPQRPTKCTCGRKSTGAACLSLRCPCARAKKSCAKLCTCKECHNTYGIRPPPSTTRRRQSYDNQRQPLQGKRGSEFMIQAGESSNDGHLTTLESLLLKSIIVYFILHGFEVSVTNTFYVYKLIYNVSRQCDSINFPLLDRNIKCIDKFLRKVFCILELLHSFFKLS